jgi:hypothetical protein
MLIKISVQILIKNILVDESQDTNPIRRVIIGKLMKVKSIVFFISDSATTDSIALLNVKQFFPIKLKLQMMNHRLKLKI